MLSIYCIISIAQSLEILHDLPPKNVLRSPPSGIRESGRQLGNVFLSQIPVVFSRESRGESVYLTGNEKRPNAKSWLSRKKVSCRNSAGVGTDLANVNHQPASRGKLYLQWKPWTYLPSTTPRVLLHMYPRYVEKTIQCRRYNSRVPFSTCL